MRNCVAVERGPLVFCAESVDLPGGRHVDVLEVDPATPPRDRAGSVVVAAHLVQPEDRRWPYGDEPAAAAQVTETADVALYPYHDWANRGPSTMRVWMPVASERARRARP